MDIEVDPQRIVNKFKRNGHHINKISLEMVSQHLRGIHDPNKRLDEIITKMNEMVIKDQKQLNDHTLKLAIDLLNLKSQNGKKFTSYDTFLEHLKNWTTYYLSPYQSTGKCKFQIILVLVDKPDPSLFQFQPSEYLQMNINRYKSIYHYNFNKFKVHSSSCFIGVLYEKYMFGQNKIMLHNQTSEVELIFSVNFQLQYFLIPGCTYIAEGDLKNKEYQLVVSKLSLPEPLPAKKNNLMYQKLQMAFENIQQKKNSLDFSEQDFKTYDFVYNKSQKASRPILIFGNVLINLLQMQKLKVIVQSFKSGVQCLILMIGEGEHQQIDLHKFFGDNLYIVLIPHIHSQGPRVLPKIPVLKNFYNVKVATNPAKFSIQGRECVFLNYPLVKNLYTKSIIPKQMANVDPNQIAQKVSSMIYSQNNIALANKIYWRQSSYFDISQNETIFICDKACPQILHKNGKGEFVSVGDYSLDRDFVCFRPHKPKDQIQLCTAQK